MTTTLDESRENSSRSNTGRLILILVAFPTIDAFGMAMGRAGERSGLVIALGACGFAMGEALVTFVTARTEQPRWWPSRRWVACGLGALIGLGVTSFIIGCVVSG